jgi:hypothetical protein
VPAASLCSAVQEVTLCALGSPISSPIGGSESAEEYNGPQWPAMVRKGSQRFEKVCLPGLSSSNQRKLRLRFGGLRLLSGSLSNRPTR